MEFKAKFVDGVLNVYPVVESTPNANGGNDIVVHALTPTAVQEAKQEILMKMALGQAVDIKVEVTQK